MTTDLRVIETNGGKTGAYIGFEALAKILAATKEPVTAAQVSSVCGIGPHRAKSLMHQFRILGLVHRVGFVKPSHGYSSPVYLLGEGENCPAPLLPDGRPQPHIDHRPVIQGRVLTFSAIVKSMQDGPVTAIQVIEQSHCGQSNGRAAIKALHAVGLCYRADFVRRDVISGPLVARYEFGVDGKNARRPKVETVRRRDESRRVFRPAWHNMLVQLAGKPMRCMERAS